MWLRLFHPGPARINCQDCQKFIYNLETGEQQTYKATVNGERVELPQARPPNVPTPCDQCPKKSPERAAEFELSPKNQQAFRHYLAAKAVGLTEEERNDPIVRRNFALINRLMHQHDRYQQARMNAIELLKVLPVGRGKA